MIRVAVVGCGHQGQKHLEAYTALEDVEIVAVVDLSSHRLESVGERFDIGKEALLGSVGELAKCPQLDLVSVCTLPTSHEEIVVSALDLGANVLCEKPVALSAEAFRRMLAAAERAGRFLTGGFNMRQMGSARVLRELVENGAIGAPISIRASCLDTAIPWWGPHYIRELAGGGVITADAGHVLDLALWVAGFPRPETVTASMRQLFPTKRGTTAPTTEAASRFDVEDWAGGFVRLEGNAWLILELAWSADLPEPLYGFELQGEHGWMRFAPLLVMLEEDGRPVDCTPAQGADTDWDASVRRGVESVVAAVRDGVAPLVRPDEMLVVQETIDALYRSATTRREVLVR